MNKIKFLKKLKRIKKFKNLLEQFKISKSTITFKINIVKLVDKHTKMLTLSITLNFLNSYYKDIKNVIMLYLLLYYYYY